MWKPGSMGHDHGWHYGQAHEMMHEMHEHAMRWPQAEGYGASHGIPDLLSSFIASFGERMGEEAADALTGNKAE